MGHKITVYTQGNIYTGGEGGGHENLITFFRRFFLGVVYEVDLIKGVHKGKLGNCDLKKDAFKLKIFKIRKFSAHILTPFKLITIRDLFYFDFHD